MLQLTVVFMCRINQLSPSAYLLHRDLFPTIISVSVYRPFVHVKLIADIFIQIIKGWETGRFTFEALLLLTLLSNFHKSDVAKLNPFLRHIGEIRDVKVLHKMCWAAKFAAAATAR